MVEPSGEHEHRYAALSERVARLEEQIALPERIARLEAQFKILLAILALFAGAVFAPRFSFCFREAQAEAERLHLNA